MMLAVLAQTIDPTAGPDPTPDSWWDLGAGLALPAAWVPIVALFIPVLVGLVTRYRAPGQRLAHALVAVVLSGVLAAVAMLVDATPDTVGGLLSAFLAAFLTQLGAYTGLWSMIGRGQTTDGRTAGINEALPKAGL